MKTIIRTDKAPKPIGPYNQAIMANGLLYSAGQIAMDPGTGELIAGDIKDETRQTLENVKAILHEAGMDMRNIIKASIYILDMKAFKDINEVYASFFEDKFPAREVIEVNGLPKNAAIEISVVAAK